MKYWTKLKLFFSWFKKLIRIVNSYDQNHTYFVNRIIQAERIIKDRTDISVDIHCNQRHENQIILTGTYRKVDYVEVFSIPNGDMNHLVNLLRDMRRHGNVRRIDAPYGMKAVIERDLSYGG